MQQLLAKLQNGPAYSCKLGPATTVGFSRSTAIYVHFQFNMRDIRVKNLEVVKVKDLFGARKYGGRCGSPEQCKIVLVRFGIYLYVNKARGGGCPQNFILTL